MTESVLFAPEQPTNKSKFADRVGLRFISRNLPRTLLALSTTLIFSFFMTAMQSVADNRAIAVGLHHNAGNPLPDILMDYASNSVPMHMADLLLNSFIFFTIVVFLVSWRFRIQRCGLAEGHFRTFRIARKFFWMLACAYLFRSFALLSTTMPPTDPRCVYKQRNWRQIPFTAIEIMTKRGNTCSDKIFSGHSSMATLLCLFWLGALLRPDNQVKTVDSESKQKQNVPIWRKLSAAGIVAWATSVYIFCVLCRNHYSIDIVVAILVCTGIFSVYQLSLRIIELLQMDQQQDSNLLKSSSAVDSHFWSTPYLYAPVDPEAALECASPVITMQNIIQQDDFKPRPASDSAPVNNMRKLSYVPRPFVLFLRAVAWMDGNDLKP